MRTITKCTDGTYRWIYELNMIKNPVILLRLFRIFGYIGVGLWAFDIILDPDRFFTDQVYARSTAKIFLFVILGLYVLCILGYFIYAKMLGGKYIVIFEMNRQGIRHTQAPKQYEKAQLMAMIAALTGAAGGDPASAGAGLLAATQGSKYTKFEKVKNVREHPWSNFIEVNAPFNKNMIFAEDEDYKFVIEFLKNLCRNAKFK